MQAEITATVDSTNIQRTVILWGEYFRNKENIFTTRRIFPLQGEYFHNKENILLLPLTWSCAKIKLWFTFHRCCFSMLLSRCVEILSDCRQLGSELEKSNVCEFWEVQCELSTNWVSSRGSGAGLGRIVEIDVNSFRLLLRRHVSTRWWRWWWPSKDFLCTRPKPAYGRQGLDWIIGPGYSFGVFSTSRSRSFEISWRDWKVGPKLTKWPPLVQKTWRHWHGAPSDLIWSKKRDVTDIGPQLTSFDPENMPSLTRGPNWPPLVQKTWRHWLGAPTDLLDV